MFYREAGDFSTTYPQDSQTFPIRFDRYRYYFVLVVAVFVMPFVMNDYLVNSIFHAVFDLCHCRHRFEHPDGLLRSGVLGHRWVHGCGRLCLLQADDWCGELLSGCEHLFPRHHCRGDHSAWSARPLVCRLCGSRGFIWRLPPWRRSSFWCGCSTRWRGFTTIPHLVRSTRLSANCVCELRSRAPIPKPGPPIFSALSLLARRLSPAT